MNLSSEPQKRILFLFSDTGGGHRSAAEAIIEALHIEFGDRFKIDMVDVFKLAPRPLNRMPELYPTMVKIPQAWGLGYHLSDGHTRARLITAGAWPYVRTAIQGMVAEHPSDLIVSVHPLANAPTLRALGEDRPPYVTVVTDLVSVHALWYHRRTDLCIVPTEAARERGLIYGMRPRQVRVVGLPVADRFCQPPGNRQELRERLGWPQDLPVILLMGGSEGMGPLEKTAQALAEARLPAAMVIVAGRNHALKARLEGHSWPNPTFIYGFVRDMPDFMRAADILVTKAGPGTISEATNAGLPMVLYSRVPGQEDGNVTYVISEGVGLWAPRADQIVEALKTWLGHPELLRQAAANCRRVARPQAAREIARILGEKVGIKTIPRI